MKTLDTFIEEHTKENDPSLDNAISDSEKIIFGLIASTNPQLQYAPTSALLKYAAEKNQSEYLIQVAEALLKLEIYTPEEYLSPTPLQKISSALSKSFSHKNSEAKQPEYLLVINKWIQAYYGPISQSGSNTESISKILKQDILNIPLDKLKIKLGIPEESRLLIAVSGYNLPEDLVFNWVEYMLKNPNPPDHILRKQADHMCQNYHLKKKS